MKNGKLKIERGVPIPQQVRNGRTGVICTLMRSMKKDDSILLHAARGTVNAQAYNYLGKGKYVVRKEGNGFRVWKIA